MPGSVSENKTLRWIGILLTEMVLAEVLLSYIAIVVLRMGRFANTYAPTFIALLSGLFVYFVVTIIFLNRCCFDLLDKKLYYKTVGIAYGIFIAISVIFKFVCYMDTYTWLFGLYKIFNYTVLPVGSLGSVFIVHVFMIIAILIVPQHLSYLLTEESEISWTDKEYRIVDIAEALKKSSATEAECRKVLVGFSDELTYDDITELLSNDN